MEIAFVTSLGVHKYGGTQKSTAWLIEDLAKEHKISVFAPYVEGIEVNRINFFKIPIINKPAILRYLTFLLLNTISFVVLKVFRENRFDIINVTGSDCLFANVITAHYCVAEYLRLVKEGRVPWPEKDLRQELLNLSYRLYYLLTNITERRLYSRKNIKLIIAVSEGLKRDIIRHYHRCPEEIVVIPNAVDEEMFMDQKEILIFRQEIRARYGISSNEIVLLFVAAGDWRRKGLPLVIEALSYLKEEVRLVVVGKDETSFYLTMAKEKGTQDKIIFAGPSSDVRRFYAASDIFVFPSYFEAFSMVTLEAAASGLPIITTRINGTEELIQDDYNGFFVKPDPRDIADKIEVLSKNQELRKTMGENARKSAMRFRRQEITRKTVEVFQKVISISSKV